MTVGEKKALQAKNRQEKLMMKEKEELKKKKERLESGEDEMVVEDDGDELSFDFVERGTSETWVYKKLPFIPFFSCASHEAST
jgi:hypothetical protein